MRTATSALLMVVMLVVCAGKSQAQGDDVWVNVLIGGKPAMGFIPATERSKSLEGGVRSEVQDANAKMRDGARVSAFEFKGWKERDGYRVLVLALVRTETGSLKSVEFDSLHVRAGQQVVLNKMKDVGVTPWTIRVGRFER